MSPKRFTLQAAHDCCTRQTYKRRRKRQTPARAHSDGMTGEAVGRVADPKAKVPASSATLVTGRKVPIGVRRQAGVRLVRLHLS